MTQIYILVSNVYFYNIPSLVLVSSKLNTRENSVKLNGVCLDHEPFQQNLYVFICACMRVCACTCTYKKQAQVIINRYILL